MFFVKWYLLTSLKSISRKWQAWECWRCLVESVLGERIYSVGKGLFCFWGLLTFWRNMRINSTSINTLKILTRLVNLVPSLEKSIESSQSVDSRFSVQLSASRKNNFQLPVQKSNIHYGKGLRTGEELPRFSDEFNTIRHCPISCTLKIINLNQGQDSSFKYLHHIYRFDRLTAYNI